ncbi:hypothetical protein GLOTRDRAFT_115141 [Gloeophyllum trabeum ATCC 11539]|uniref:4a-hydroxytetrahydrobiopterin dehydratase n=1 Tax=Gloeophyllum trabeum (strain ATCC 11539 / FP-39264 / Madison 617) TaxID=670483 RepID=S7QCJ7_GLOTA|nr:uncharacterized protein GLOTRDRAFT_115141 [Gloeophyllum trabeum ATCC 11539]EPQ57067.1 hypothetical protein GLOTRDRAFT_115141 [Gloeophyllum trabeum ATCC 11539]
MLARLSASSLAALKPIRIGGSRHLVSGYRCLSTPSATPTTEPSESGKLTERHEPWPPKPKVPTLLSTEEAEQYSPILSRRFWKYKQTPPTLFKIYAFKKYDDVVLFANMVANLAKTENHHPVVRFSYDQVRVSVRTHTAVDPSAKTERERIVSGVTLQDVRFALRVEDVFYGVFLRTGRADTKVFLKAQQLSERGESQNGEDPGTDAEPQSD